MAPFDYSQLYKVFLRLLSSRKFWVLLLPVLASFGLDMSPDVQALILFGAGVIFAGTTAWEDAASKRAGGS